MDIEKFIKEHRTRIAHDNNWLVWDVDEQWVVYSHKYGAKHNDCLYRGDSLESALAVLVTS